MPPPKREPGWVQPFLAALGVCGNVTRSARLAGVDVTGPYNRRARYPGFRAAWERVMATREARASGGFCEDSERALTLPPLCGGPLPLPPAGEGLVVGHSSTGVRLGRAAKSRWSPAVEERFLEELSASANVALAAKAADFSATAIYKRKLRDRHFASGWGAAIAVGRSRLEAHLLVAAERCFDPEALPIVEGTPRVSFSEALGFLKLKPAAAARSEEFPSWQEEADSKSESEIAEIRGRMVEKLERLKALDDEDRLAKGWTREGEEWVPPGWIKSAG